jgi:hypothetical protein
MHLAGFEHAVPASERPKTHTLDGAYVLWDRANNYTCIGKHGDCWECSETDAARRLAVTWSVSDRSFRVSTEVSFHPQEGPVQTVQE